MIQNTLFDEFLASTAEEDRSSALGVGHPFPTTRYQGSKSKLIPWIESSLDSLSYTTVLDAFGGTGVVSHMFKRLGKSVCYNDLLKFNAIIGKGLIENPSVILSDDKIEDLLTEHKDRKYPDFIQKRFQGLFYLPEENQWLDKMAVNIPYLRNPYQRAIAWFALFQSAIIKRPYNLFHRANLSVRMENVKRRFGNKTTWDGSFERYFCKFAQEANQSIFDNGMPCRSIQSDVMDIVDPEQFDLVYIDPPYLSHQNVGTDYLDYYHFLEGIVDYANWESRILPQYKHCPLKGKGESDWIRKDRIEKAFDGLIQKFQKSILVISYRNDGIPSQDALCDMLKKYGKTEIRIERHSYRYVLSNRSSAEILIIAE